MSDALFLSPDSIASATQLASILKPEISSPTIASGAIGRVGKKFSEFLKIHPEVAKYGYTALTSDITKQYV